VARRDEDPKTLDPGRVGLAMRARQQGDERYPFVRLHAVRRGGPGILALTAAAVLAGLLYLLFA
jgi:hypothetical protein